MTAEELIDELHQVPPDREVWLDCGDPYDRARVNAVVDGDAGLVWLVA